MTIPAYILTRVSSEDQASDEKTSLSEQERACREYADAEGFEVIEVFSDDVSGKYGLDERPNGRRLLAALDRLPAGTPVITIVARLDRLARSVVKGLEDIQTLTDPKRDRSLVILDSPIGKGALDTTDEQGEMMLTILLAFAQYERRLIATRMEIGRSGKARKGLWSGGQPPLGWTTTEEGKVVIDETEGDTVRRLFALAVAEGQNPTKVAATLTAEGHKTKRGGSWGWSQVVEVLSREAYVGEIGLTKTHSGETFKIEAPAIVSPEVFEAAAKILTARKRRKAGAASAADAGKPRGWKYGLAGRAFHVHADDRVLLHGELRRSLRRYRCSEPTVCSGFGSRENGVTLKSIEARTIETVVLEALLGMLADPDRLAEYQADYDRAAVAEYGGASAVLDMKSKLADLADRIAVEAKAVSIGEMLAGSTEAEAAAAAESAVTVLQAEQAATTEALARAEDREAQRLSVMVTVDELLSGTIVDTAPGPEGIDPSTPIMAEE